VKKSGFTLIELMVAMVVGLTAITSVYALGSAMSRQFYEEQRLATSQGTSRVAIMELRRDVSRAGLFGTPNGQLEPTCDTNPPALPLLGGGSGTMGAFQYWPDADTSTVLNPAGNNPNVSADRLRVLTSLYLTDQLLVHSTDITGSTIVIQSGNQAYRRTFAWGQSAGPFTSGADPEYLDGTLDWDSAWAGETASWKGISQKGARAFQTGSVLHVETPEGRHFFRSVFGRANNTEDEIRITVTPNLPVGTACLPGAAEGSTMAPLQWVEYALVNPFDTSAVGTDFFGFDGMFFIDLDPAKPSYNLQNVTAATLRESPNLVLVRRILNANTGNVEAGTTQIVAEFVANFEVSFLIDTAAAGAAPNLQVVGGDSSAQSAVNNTPENVRAVIIDLGIRNPLENPNIEVGASDAGTRFEVDPNQQGSARVRNMHIEIPVSNVARRNL
jgi:prepilin-type N-terminal cleavage/methylation domain-containing protein